MFKIVIIAPKFLTMNGTVAQTLINPYKGNPQAQKNRRPVQIQNAGLFFRLMALGNLKSSRK